MKTRLFFALKYIFFAFVAFTVPKMIVDSGRIVAPLEPSPTSTPAPPVQKTRSFWPFRFLQSSPSSSASAGDLTDGATAPRPSVSTSTFASSYPSSPSYPSSSLYAPFPRDAFSDVESANGRLAPAEPSDFNERASFNGYLSAANAAPLAADSRFGDAPLSSPEERSSFARFAESRFAPTPSASSASSAASPPFASAATSARLAGSVSTPRTFEELFRFGHSPAWLVENWPRVDAVATDDGLVGYRVAISTGDGDDDLTGVFACYFDATSERRVEFSGQTGDYRRLLRFMQREYGVALSPDSTAERFVYESTLSNGRGGCLPGRLVVRPSRVFLRGAEKSFFEIDVVLEHPYNRAN